MEIVNRRRKLLDAVESYAKRNNNCAIKVISTENVEGKSSIKKKSKKKESNVFLSIFQVITLDD